MVSVPFLIGVFDRDKTLHVRKRDHFQGGGRRVENNEIPAVATDEGKTAHHKPETRTVHKVDGGEVEANAGGSLGEQFFVNMRADVNGGMMVDLTEKTDDESIAAGFINDLMIGSDHIQGGPFQGKCLSDWNHNTTARA